MIDGIGMGKDVENVLLVLYGYGEYKLFGSC